MWHRPARVGADWASLDGRGLGGVVDPPLLGRIATVTGYATAVAPGRALAFLAAATAALGIVEGRPAVGDREYRPEGEP